MPEPVIVLHGLDTIYEKINDWLQERPIENDLMSVQVVLNTLRRVENARAVFLVCFTKWGFQGACSCLRPKID